MVSDTTVVLDSRSVTVCLDSVLKLSAVNDFGKCDLEGTRSGGNKSGTEMDGLGFILPP